ncbi:MAG TPA: deoxyribodipyrimidine photo-lyase [Gemmatimonadaceae bacterium]|nr:deoxyribodipyrimidine photo-lyase [Gemmatimonadaceae bacterium]
MPRPFTKTMHPLGSPYVRDQLSLRTTTVNETRLQPDGEFVLYWMQTTQRLEENWALRLATLEADRLSRPLIIHQGLDPTYEFASDRFHTFTMEGARELAVRAAGQGYHYQFVLRRRRDDDRRVVDRLANRACLVVTDAFPTAGVAERTARFAARARCRVVAVDSVGIVPTATFYKEEYAARTIRPKLAKLLDYALEPVEDRPPRKLPTPALIGSLHVDTLDLARCDIAGEVARCEIDHAVAPAPVPAGLTAARRRLAAFVAEGLRGYSSRRREPTDEGGSSRLSAYLRFGQISAAEVARTVRAAGAEAEGTAFLDEMVTWRELSLNFCTRNPRHASLAALPDWAQRSLRRHADDPREADYSLEELEAGATHEPLWNAGQRELVTTGYMHNAVRILWGKSVLLWTRTYDDALQSLLYLNNKYGLDGRDPNSFANVLWCFGKFDRPFATRRVWGTIRPMSLARARDKFDVEAYVERWGEAGTGDRGARDRGAARGAGTGRRDGSLRRAPRPRSQAPVPG